jgi:hypothetical protein
MTNPAFDLAQLSPAESAVVEIYHPVSKVNIGISITVASTDSEAFRKASQAQQNKRLKQMTRGRRGAGTALTAEEMEEESLDLLASCTLGWEGVNYGTDPLPFSKEAARNLYRKHAFIREQVDEAMADRSLFLKS